MCTRAATSRTTVVQLLIGLEVSFLMVATSAGALILSKSKLEVNYEKEVIGLAYFDLIARTVGTAKISR